MRCIVCSKLYVKYSQLAFIRVKAYAYIHWQIVKSSSSKYSTDGLKSKAVVNNIACCIHFNDGSLRFLRMKCSENRGVFGALVAL